MFHTKIVGDAVKNNHFIQKRRRKEGLYSGKKFIRNKKKNKPKPKPSRFKLTRPDDFKFKGQALIKGTNFQRIKSPSASSTMS